MVPSLACVLLESCGPVQYCSTLLLMCSELGERIEQYVIYCEVINIF